MTALYIGIDVSTQAAKLSCVDDQLHLVHSASVNYDTDLPSYGTSGGVFKRAGGVVVTPTTVFVDALGLLFDKLKSESFPFDRVVAISGSGQQHGSVYWSAEGIATLKALDAKRTLSEQLGDSVFTIKESPIWMDSSTTEICRQLEQLVGGKEALCQLTGSVAYERFTGNQIAKIARENAEAYKSTERISLISSFSASLLAQTIVPIDVSDGAGMNLMDIEKKAWSEKCLAFADGDDKNTDRLASKLGTEIVPSCNVVGDIGSWFVERYGLRKDCKVVAFAGDNPSSLCALPLSGNDLVISLGTSDTAFLTMEKLPEKPLLEASLLVHPIDPSAYFAMLVYKSGSLVRQGIRDKHAGASWDKFDQLVKETPAGCGGSIGFFCEDPEILPAGLVGFHRFKDRQPLPQDKHFGSAEPRACVESRFLDMRLRADSLGIKPARIIAVGGGSQSIAILQVAADVFGVDVFRAKGGGDAAAVGGCTRAAFALKEAGMGKKEGAITERFRDMFDGSAREVEKVCSANKGNTAIYVESVLPMYQSALKELGY